MAMMWLNWSIAKINTTIQLLDIYIYNKQETNHMCNCLLLREREREREREIVLESLILLFHPLDCSPNLAHTY